MTPDDQALTSAPRAQDSPAQALAAWIRPRRLVFVTLGLELLLLSVVIALVVAIDLRTAERSFTDHVNALHQHVSNRALTNETVVEGFAATLAVMEELDRPKVRVYASRMLDRYPHIFMFEVAQKVPREQLEAFVTRFRRTVGASFTVKAFSYETDRQWQPLDDRPYYVPIVFMQPMPAASQEVLGLDMSSNEFFLQSLRESGRRHMPAVTDPFQLVEGPLAYLIHRPVPKDTDPDYQGSHAHDIHDRYALLVIRADSLLPAGAAARPGMRVTLRHTALEADDPKGRLFRAAGPGRSTTERLLFPLLLSERPLDSDTQPFLLTAEQQLGWGDLSWGSLSFIVAAGLISIAVVMVYARAYHRAEIQRLNATDRLFYLANHDSLTGLANRNMLRDRVGHALVQAKRQGGRLAVIFLDLDGFKQVNDNFGHERGDLVLRGVAERLRACLREGDTIARYGGDEFVVVLENVTDDAVTTGVAEKIQAAFAQSFATDGHEIALGVSIGTARYPEDGDDLDTLIGRADTAMYADKHSPTDQTAGTDA